MRDINEKEGERYEKEREICEKKREIYEKQRDFPHCVKCMLECHIFDVRKMR